MRSGCAAAGKLYTIAQLQQHTRSYKVTCSHTLSMAQRNCKNEDMSLYVESDNDSEQQFAEYPDIGDLTGSLDVLSPAALNEVTDTVLSALSEQDSSPLASKEEILRCQDDLRVSANTHANAGIDAKAGAAQDYPQTVPDTADRAQTEPPAVKRVCFDATPGLFGENQPGVNTTPATGSTRQTRQDAPNLFTLPSPATGFGASGRPPVAPTPVPLPATEPAVTSSTATAHRAPAVDVNTRPSPQHKVVPAAPAQSSLENYAMQSRRQQQQPMPPPPVQASTAHRHEDAGLNQHWYQQPVPEYTWRDPLQAVRTWGQQQVLAPPTPPIMQAPLLAANNFRDPLREMNRPNLAPPQMSTMAVQPTYTTSFPSLDIHMPSGLRTIQGWSPQQFPTFDHNPSNAHFWPQTMGWGNFLPSDPNSYLDLANFLPTSMLQSIRARAYIDFSKLLPDNNDDEMDECEEMELPMQGSSTLQCVVRHKKVKTQSIDGIIKWIRAFCIWSFVFLDTHPHEGKGLFQHLYQILDGDRQFVWTKVYKYDKAVRNNLAKDNSLKMGIMDLKLWQNISGHVKRQLHVNYRQSPAQGRASSGRGTKKGKPACRQFNEGNCNRENCRFAHVCELCKSDSHTKHQCKHKAVGNVDGAAL